MNKILTDKQKNRTSLFKLFYTFASIGVVTFGGGYAMLPFLEREVVIKNKWIDNQELLDYYSLAQCTPGIIAVNVSTFIGYKERGILGAIISTLGMIFPSLLIISLISKILLNFTDNKYFQMAFSGIRVSVCALILKSIIKLSKNSIVDWITFLVFILILLITFFTSLSTIFILILGIVLGFIFPLLKSIISKNDGVL